MIATSTTTGQRRRGRATDVSRSVGARATRSLAARDALIAQHLGLVHHVARKLAARLSTAADLDELLSAGTLGLLQAADAFDASRQLSFSTFAVPRIRGAILDELRKQDYVPRNVRRRSRDVARARDVLTESLHRTPTEAELSGVLRVSPHMLRRWEIDAEWASFISLDQPSKGGEDVTATLAETVADQRGTSMEDALTHEREVERVKCAIRNLKEQERTVLALNFFEELRLPQIAEVLGVSVCRVSQIRTAALARLRDALSDLRAA